MKTVGISTIALSLTAGILARAENAITVANELERLRSADHLFRPQSYRLRQYSGFDRKGGNPDRVNCLYEENGWRVIADHEGPGVASRIWTTRGAEWGEIQVEVDDQTIFSGNAREFFQQKNLSFRKPLSEVRHSHSGEVTVEGETPGRNAWAVSYAPIPFAKRFRYLQRNPVYANIDLKEFPPGTKVESFLKVNWDELKPDFENTAAVWEGLELYGPELKTFQRISKSISVKPATADAERAIKMAELQGPAIIRGIRIKSQKPAAYQDVTLTISWDGKRSPAIQSPLDNGFGSRQQRTLAIGESKDGWRVLYLPMPFRKSASMALVSKAAAPADFVVEIFLEKPARLPAGVLYLHRPLLWGCVAVFVSFRS